MVAISRGSPMRFSNEGGKSHAPSSLPAAAISAASSVAIQPGLMQLTRMPSGAGVSPWTVLAQCIAFNTDWSIGFTTMVVSFLILLLWVPLKQKPGIGTILNAIIIALMIDFSLTWLPYPGFLGWQLMQAAVGVLLAGIASGIYLTANPGARPQALRQDCQECKAESRKPWKIDSTVSMELFRGWSPRIRCSLQSASRA